ncbi:hypothetical protein ABEB36_006417 [Hypothenemus hampei]|uniref:Transmembrane protein n=1 Tax=Hypothenemus hampei TaxID=57062 RepID=A0ABD1ER61_HYPHA
MAFIEKCFCCSLPIACGFFAAYLLIAYLIAFAFELIWIILESSSKVLPAVAVLLSAGYFAMSLFAALLLHGLATKNTLCLVTWIFATMILTIPEAGLAIHMAVNYWGIGHIYGITELCCWLLRIMINVIQMVLIQSLYTLWKDEDLIDKRIQELSGVAVVGADPQFYHNSGFEHSPVDQVDGSLKRYGSMPQLWNNHNYNFHMVPLAYPPAGFNYSSEFNASIFVPDQSELIYPEKKSHSLVDLRFLDYTFPRWPAVGKAMSEVNYAATLPSTKLTRCQSMDGGLNEDGHSIIKNRTGFYARPLENYGVPIYYGPLDGPDFLIYKKQLERLNSRNSLSNNSADEISKYRDVAL